MNFFGIGTPEIAIIVLILLLLFGPKDLPEIARKIGGATKQMRDTLNSVNDEMTGMMETVKKIEEGQMIPPLITDAPKPPAASDVSPSPTVSEVSAAAPVAAESTLYPDASSTPAAAEVHLPEEQVPPASVTLDSPPAAADESALPPSPTA